MHDDQLRKLADTRPGYATYRTSRPGSPSWWLRPVDGVQAGPLGRRPDSLTDHLVARHGTPMVAALDDARDRYEAAERTAEPGQPLPPVPENCCYPPDAVALPVAPARKGCSYYLHPFLRRWLGRWRTGR